MGVGHAHALYVHEHSSIHRLAPEAKLVAIFFFIVAVAVTPRQAVWAFVLYAVLMALIIRLGRVPMRFVAARLTVILPFVLFAVLLPFIAGGNQVEILGLSVSRDGLWATWNVLAKASLGAAGSIVLAATTEIPEILRGLQRLRVPPPLIAIAGFMVRYLEVIADELGRMRTAMVARGYDPRWLWQAKPIASAAGATFIRSYERGERVHAAMVARGFTGTMPAADRARATGAEWRLAAAVPAVAWLIAVLALVIT